MGKDGVKKRLPIMALPEIYLLLKLLKENQGRPLVFSRDWENDVMGTFFKTCVKDGIGTWKSKIEVIK